MILGENSEQRDFRHLREEVMIQEWLESLDTMTAVEYGARLGSLVRVGIKAWHQQSDLWTIIIQQQAQARRRLGGEIIDEEVDLTEVGLKAITAWLVFRGSDSKGQATGYDDIDELLRLEKEFFESAASTDRVPQIIDLTNRARKAAETIYYRTGPPAIAA